MAGWVHHVSLFLMSMVYIGECSLDFVSECAMKGFTSGLACSTCDTMAAFNPKLAALDADCRRCCQADDQEGGNKTKFPFAELVVCQWKLGRFPQVQAFVKSDRRRQFPGLSIKYARGADPVIKLLDADRQVVETLGIDKWDTDAVEEFFREHLS